MSATARKWGLRLLKFAVCAGALWYLSGKVTLDDYARLADDPTALHRIIEESEQTLRFEYAGTGEVRTISRDALYQPDAPTGETKALQPIERGLKSIARRADWSWTSWAILAMGPSVLIMAWRLRLLLATQGITISFKDSILLTFAGNFFNFSMPGTTGGDLYKAYHIAKRTEKRTEGITIVLLDRIIGLISFLLLAVVAIFVARGKDMVGDFGNYVGYFMLAFAVAFCLYFSRRVRRLVRYEKLLNKLPFADKIRRIDETAFSFRYYRLQAAASLLGTLVNHFLIVTSIYFLARGLGIHPNLGRSTTDLYLACMVSAVVGFLLAAVPVSVQGFGLMEAVFFKVMVGGGWCSASQMLALTLGTRLVQVTWSLPGVLVPWMGLKPPPRHTHEELETVEGSSARAVV